MNPSSKKRDLNELRFLISQCIAGSICREDFMRLESLLEASPQMRSYYREYLSVYCDLTSLLGGEQVDSNEVSGVEDNDFWEAMARYEKAAPAIEVPKEKIQESVVLTVERPKLLYKKKLNKWDRMTLIAAIAAILLIVLFVRFAPAKKGVQVAVLADSLNAKWADINGPMENGTSIVTSVDSMLLRQGYAELLFNTNARVTIEGPAEFQILAEDMIKLNYGKLYATVPFEAIGFTVNTSTAKVIDLGTEFGVQADLNGDTILHVIKGKTTLVAGEKFNKTSIQVEKDRAKRVSAATSKVSDVKCDDRLFVRHVNSDDRILWRGQMEFNLADVVGGGNGFGTGQLDEGISLSDGAMKSDYHGKGLRGTGDYIPVLGSTFLDGVFVPGAVQKPVQISSQSHTFKECPATSRYYTVIKNGGIAKAWAGKVYPLELNGQVYGTPENPVIQLRSNGGITFDLDAVRNAMPGCNIQAFQSVVGISSNTVEISKLETTPVDGQLIDVFSARDGKIGKADIFVLVDGQLRQTASLTCDPATIINMDIKLMPKDRFLTLVSTQGDNEWTHDWVMFAKPRLILNTAE